MMLWQDSHGTITTIGLVARVVCNHLWALAIFLPTVVYLNVIQCFVYLSF